MHHIQIVFNYNDRELNLVEDIVNSAREKKLNVSIHTEGLTKSEMSFFRMIGIDEYIGSCFARIWTGLLGIRIWTDLT